MENISAAAVCEKSDSTECVIAHYPYGVLLEGCLERMIDLYDLVSCNSCVGSKSISSTACNKTIRLASSALSAKSLSV